MIDRIASFATNLALQSQVEQTQSQISRLVNEISSGQSATPRGGATLYALQYAAGQQTAYQSSIGQASNRLDTMQTALSAIAKAAQGIGADALNGNAQSAGGLAILGAQGQQALDQVIGLLNTQYAGQAVFAGDDSAGTPMLASDAPGGPLATMNAVLSAAVAAKGGPLSAADVDQLVDGPNGIASVFDDTNTNPGQTYAGAFYAAKDDGKPLQVVVGAAQAVSYDVKADDQGFRDLLQGVSMLALLNAPTSELDDSAKSALAGRAASLIGTAQSEITADQATLGIAQARLQQAADTQKAAAANTQQQIVGFTQADTYADATMLAQLQTQLQASYELTAQISKLSLANYPQIFAG